MKYSHEMICNAPICAGDTNPDYRKNVIWYAGEEVCQKSPYTKFQRKQLDINKCVKLGKFKNLEVAFTALDLETRSI